jgi:hypothetical protein
MKEVKVKGEVEGEVPQEGRREWGRLRSRARERERGRKRGEREEQRTMMVTLGDGTHLQWRPRRAASPPSTHRATSSLAAGRPAR